MLDDLFGELGTVFGDLVDSEAFQIGIRVLVAYIVLIWLASAFWAYRDMRLRTASAVGPYIAAGMIILFTPIFFLFGLLIYRIVRSKETIAEVNERALAEEAMLAEVQSRPHCANCERPVHEDWIICPTCRNRLRRVCPNCEHLIELDWTLCAWCGKDFERAESPGTAYMPTARPTPQLPPQHAHTPGPQRPPPPPPPRIVMPPPPAPAGSGPVPSDGTNPAGDGATPPPPPPAPPTQPQPRSLGSSPSQAQATPGDG